ncbi:hypothetical protein [Jiulongibacter sediminis]|jgi:hypothetical protein|uniref:hypothetical protein n=1 Tax=Jiulongibacter sediminis TaxID=1605367 RepID=UPI0026EFB1B2|nr:hypothetical protein [Jiulongibacter sediminis]
MKDRTILEEYIRFTYLALENDDVEYISIRWPEDFMPDDFLVEFEQFYERENNRFGHLFKLVADYFDSKSHGFDSSVGKSIEEYRRELIDYLEYFVHREDLKIKV